MDEVYEITMMGKTKYNKVEVVLSRVIRIRRTLERHIWAMKIGKDLVVRM